MSTEVLVALALLVSPSPTPTAEVPRVMVTPPKGPIPQRMPQGAAKTVTLNVPAGWHVHRCAHGHEPVEWAHSDVGLRGNVTAHACPKCGIVHWNPVRHGPTTITKTVQEVSVPAVTAPARPARRPASTGWISFDSVSYSGQACPT
jgi:hypothetical protein